MLNAEAISLLVLLAIAGGVALVMRIFSGWTLAGFLSTFLLAALGAVGAWYAQQQLALPQIYAVPLPTSNTLMPVVWPTLGALLGALLGARLWRPVRRVRRGRRVG